VGDNHRGWIGDSKAFDARTDATGLWTDWSFHPVIWVLRLGVSGAFGRLVGLRRRLGPSIGRCLRTGISLDRWRLYCDRRLRIVLRHGALRRV
jgi:hypothetical protein